MKILKLLALVSLIALVAVACEKIYQNKFVPSPENCGAAISSRGINPSTFSNGIACLKAGYKDVYLGNIAGVVYEAIPEEYAQNKIQLIIKPDGNFILYTQKGAQNAHLLAKSIDEDIHNDYLNGHLLGYKEEDIKYFYDRNNETTFDQDKQAALEWIKKNP